MPVLPGDKIIFFPSLGGKDVCFALAPALVGDKGMTINSRGGKNTNVKISPALVGDTVLMIPDGLNKYIILPSASMYYGGITVLGGSDGVTSYNDVWKSYNGINWSQLTSSAGWSARSGHSSVVLNDGKTIILSGGAGSAIYSDTWKSTDGGYTWSQQSSSAGWGGGWGGRYNHSCVVLEDNSILLTGGGDPGNDGIDDAWLSTDEGITWTQKIHPSPWVRRSGHNSVLTTDNTVVIFAGGYGTPFYLSDVWGSTDHGTNWTQIKADNDIPWVRRIYPASIINDNKIIMSGGRYGYTSVRTNQVWTSTDKGVTWSQPSTSIPWDSRERHTLSLLNDNSILMTGGAGGGTAYNDVWRSDDDGATWTQLTSSAGWSARYSHSCVVV